MTLEDLDRIRFLLRSRLAFPDVLAVALEQAIVAWRQDPARRSFDWWLALPPRAPRVDVDFAIQRNDIYRQLAATVPGSTLNKSQIICEELEIWRSGDAQAESFGPPFETFLRAYRELELPHLKLTALRAIISSESCQ